MLGRILFVFVTLSLCGAASSLSCWWMDNRFRHSSNKSLNLLDSMANNSTNTTEDAEVEDTVAFPDHLYNQASKASAEDKLFFMAQIREEMVSLFEEDHRAASWEENTVEELLLRLTSQADGLRSCIGSHGHKKKNKKLHRYFRRLFRHVLEEMGHSAEAWELTRKEMKTHLMRTEQLAASLLTN
ncbi:interferon a3-like [Centropristis striata]|uniref:interferon a3-like n=1 Tax=Centropristis striata TaxID=184440 RepID=UPI0027E0DA09|nr:interferon a3-like [Centropristis striata]